MHERVALTPLRVVVVRSDVPSVAVLCPDGRAGGGGMISRAGSCARAGKPEDRRAVSVPLSPGEVRSVTATRNQSASVTSPRAARGRVQ